MITRKQVLALVAFVLVGAFIIWLGREDFKPIDDNLATPSASSTSAPSETTSTPLEKPAPQPASENKTASQSMNTAAPHSMKTTVQTSSNTPTSQSGIHKITLPHDDPDFPPGPGREVFLVRCTVCHSLRYISMQPNFSKKVWGKEVAKMINTFGAHITGAEAREITEYLGTVKGLESDKESSSAGHIGTTAGPAGTAAGHAGTDTSPKLNETK